MRGYFHKKMKEALDNAKEELKRVDHLIYVSLKYTRTCDVFKNIIARLINAIDSIIIALLKYLEKKEPKLKMPSVPGIKCKLIKEKIKDEKINELIDFYLLLRQINRASFERAREFRRHVTMSFVVNGKPMEINIDKITEYYKKTSGFLEYIGGFLEGK